MKLRTLLVLLLLLIVSSVHAQDSDNLLTNPGFEEGFRSVSEGKEVAEGWQPWNLAPGPNSPSYENAEPIYEQVAPDTTRIRSGENAQQYYTDLYFTHTGGIYQRVTEITPGAELRFSIYAYVWSSNLDDAEVSEEPAGVLVSVGIDPTGGTDPESSSIEWSVASEQYDAYRQYSVITEATSNAVTVFVRSGADFPQRNNFIFLDDAVLEVTPGSVAQQPTATEEPTDEPEPSETPVPSATPIPASDTPVPPTAVVLPTEADEDPTPTREGGGDATVPPPPTFPPPTDAPAEPSATAASNDPTDTPVPVGGPVDSQFPQTITHTVQRGDTVGRLAELYGSTISAIIDANGLDSRALIFVGQGLLIPVPISAPATVTPTATPVVVVVTATPGETGVYVVQPGDTLSQIAQNFNTTVNAVASLNGIANPNLIRVGQQLTIPGTGGPSDPDVVPTSPPAPTEEPTPEPTEAPQTYVVQPGDNLYRISLRFGVTMAELANANGIANINLVFAGQVLVIP